MNQFLSRRTFILIPTMSILKIIFNPMQVLASSLSSKEGWNLSKEEWKSRLSPESYYILREEGTERAFELIFLIIILKCLSVQSIMGAILNL